MKRYAVVRVDGSCPFIVEDIEHKDCEKIFNCNEFWNDEPCSKKCRYGDTKEQLVKKIETAITRIIQQKYIVIKYRNFTLSMTVKSLSKTIAQYLGVEE